MTINVVKLIEVIGYQNSKATATKLFAGYTADVAKTLAVAKDQAGKTGKYAGDWAKITTEADIVAYDVVTAGVTEKSTAKIKEDAKKPTVVQKKPVEAADAPKKFVSYAKLNLSKMIIELEKLDESAQEVIVNQLFGAMNELVNDLNADAPSDVDIDVTDEIDIKSEILEMITSA